MIVWSDVTPGSPENRIESVCKKLFGRSGANVNAMDNYLETPLHMAARCGYVDSWLLHCWTCSKSCLQHCGFVVVVLAKKIQVISYT